MPKLALACLLLLLGLLRFVVQYDDYVLLTISATSAALLLIAAVRRTVRFFLFGRGGLQASGVYRLTFGEDVIANLAPVHVHGRSIVGVRSNWERSGVGHLAATAARQSGSPSARRLAVRLSGRRGLLR